ncbi:MAG: DNA polymerase III subunit gamma/tau, partial [Trueperaceae bacterium]|nr:DNA polymerase III subunit gamma/tau [Trueperaceae bacterium]
MEAVYQRARPATFDEVVGQDHVKEVLAAALAKGRTGHAYLFSGPRGVGKTTSARLLAMALNCERRDEGAAPCGTCDACTRIRSGRHADVVELDAASHNSVDDVRELRERVRLASMEGGTRVWILDEAHMLSGAAANALLKTLEEPPPGLVFVLATTEPERLPATVLSRCQHFRFRRLSDAEIAGKIRGLCDAAGVEADDDALDLIARAADGAMRDAESLLERLWAGGGPLRRDDAEAALGLPPRERLEALADALGRDDLGALLEEAARAYRDGYAPRSLAERLARTLRDAVVTDAVGGDGYRSPLPRAALLRALHAFDDELQRFVRHDDLYALEATLLKTANAAHGRLAAPATDAAAPAVEAAPAAAAGGGPHERTARGPRLARRPQRRDAATQGVPPPRRSVDGRRRPDARVRGEAPLPLPTDRRPTGRTRLPDRDAGRPGVGDRARRARGHRPKKSLTGRGTTSPAPDAPTPTQPPTASEPEAPTPPASTPAAPAADTPTPPTPPTATPDGETAADVGEETSTRDDASFAAAPDATTSEAGPADDAADDGDGGPPPDARTSWEDVPHD